MSACLTRQQARSNLLSRIHARLTSHGPARSGDLADALGLSVQTTMMLCRALVRHGMAIRAPDVRRPKQGWTYRAVGETPPPPPPLPRRRAVGLLRPAETLRPDPFRDNPADLVWPAGKPGVTAEDLQWQRDQRALAEQRRARRMWA